MKKLAKIALVGGLLCFMALPVLADLDDGLVAYYPFDGNANDGSGNDGTVNGATLTEDRFGNVDSAYSFDGNNDYISVDDGSQFNFTNSLSLSLWVNPGLSQSALSYAGLIDKSHSHNSNNDISKSWVVQQVSNHTNEFSFGFAVNNTGQAFGSASVLLEPNVWNHILVSKENGTIKYYKDGTLIATFDDSVSSIDTNGNLPLIIGSVNNWNRFFNGIIDDISIYNRALSEDEIKELYELDEPNPVTCSEEPATYSNETRQAILPCLEIPLYTDINGSPINITGLYSAVLEIPFGFSDFEAKELTFLEIIEESNPTHARFNPDSGILDIPRIDVPTTVPLLVGGTVPGPTLQCSAELQQSALRAEVLMLQKFDCNLP